MADSLMVGGLLGMIISMIALIAAALALAVFGVGPGTVSAVSMSVGGVVGGLAVFLVAAACRLTRRG